MVLFAGITERVPTESLLMFKVLFRETCPGYRTHRLQGIVVVPVAVATGAHVAGFPSAFLRSRPTSSVETEHARERFPGTSGTWTNLYASSISARYGFSSGGAALVQLPMMNPS